MLTANMHDAKSQLSNLVERALAGEEVLIARNGRAVVRLVPVEQIGPRRVGGRLKGRIAIAEDFDAPLSDEVLRGFLGGD
ncbi:type II toxin-antitoxin system Phd/YefM family antitoxin [Chitinimonas koreensis]|uniref:type II toxin-antitoxin system Phd/YefM family antitoxin n=1 Tax=Chitinimonas koreensis TaxID=356302 RepID=UPI00040E381F|nr:type II toxin-antitoxin system prevent-host-death family antitoxin [Chitinimonas koreensis]QNM97812.1 type II toxin-antitoxin system prevent-host-death family antitoxin [Chitinimonas koreensis]